VTIDKQSSLVDVAFVVCTALDRTGVIAVLTGGSAAVFYSAEVMSRDIDFIVTLAATDARPHQALHDLGFRVTNGYYAHPDSPFTVEFPPGPLMVGSDAITKHATIENQRGKLHVLRRTDCVRDRLAAFYFWNDRSSLRSAVRVAESGAIDFSTVQAWSERENNREKYLEFRAALTHPGHP
jgi:hypothetical protein